MEKRSELGEIWRGSRPMRDCGLSKNNLRVLKGQGVGGWGNQVVGIRECTDCMEHWVW